MFPFSETVLHNYQAGPVLWSTKSANKSSETLKRAETILPKTAPQCHQAR